MADMKKRYAKAKKKFLITTTMCPENKALYRQFFKEQEYGLKRINNLSSLDDSCYKTLCGYISKFKNINKWFDNKPLTALTKTDIKRVYDGLEDGIIKNNTGKPFKSLKDTYYSKVFKSRLFEMAGKLELAREVIRYVKKDDSIVRFTTEETFFTMVNKGAFIQLHKLLLWVSWDFGENINSTLQYVKSDFLRQINPDTKEPEYRLNYRKEILKRSRTARSDISNYPETVRLLDEYLKNLKPDDRLFDFEYSNAKKILSRIVERVDAKCSPKGEKVTWKDLRSGMACDLLKKGWTTDEVNARLGHKPSSSEIDKYVNFLALDRHRPKQKVRTYELENLKSELEDFKMRERLLAKRNESLQLQIDTMKQDVIDSVKKMLKDGTLELPE